MNKIVILLCLFIVFGNYAKAENSSKVKVNTSSKNLIQGATFDFLELDRKMESMRVKHEVPAITVAIVRNGKLVYINCYGYQDQENKIQAVNKNLFRIASISKPVTVVALLKLMQENKLSMDDKVFGAGSILGEDFGKMPDGSNWDKITIRHLIEHKSGLHNVPDDAMFRYKGLSNKQVIERVIAERALTTVPGEQYYYSNTGYNILGRVVEKITGKGYEEYIKSEILLPCGITRMRIAGNTLEERVEDEVIYFQPNEQGWTYNMDVRRMDSHGGWIASSVDLARFIVHVDRMTTVADIVDAEYLSQTYMGNAQWSHTGSLPGTATMLTRMNDEFSFVVLMNHRSGIEGFWNDISSEMQLVIKERNSWPDIDLFKKVKW